MSVASLQVTKTYADGLTWTEAKMDTAMQSIQTYTQTSLVNNFNQFMKDTYGSAYSFDNDGNANHTNSLYKDLWGRTYAGDSVRSKSWYREIWGATWSATTPRTNSLYNKQSSTASYNTAITLPTSTGAWTEATPAMRLVFTPEATGKYLITYQFTVRTSVAGGNLTQSFAIFNRTAAATLVACESRNDPSAGVSLVKSDPITLQYIHNFSTTSAATFSLYYRVNTATATISSNAIYATASQARSLYAQIHKI